MIVVVPVCHKDAHLARINLEWVKQLEGSVPYKAILSHDRSFDPGDLLAGFKEYFAGGVEEFIYDPWNGSQNWPVPQNNAWQKIARYMPQHHDCWLWWEQDAVPIKKGWIKLLEDEYAKAKRPVLGHLRNGFTCGVMIYPENVGVMCISSLLTINKPWDSVLCDVSRNKVADTDLIQHGGKGHNVHFEGDLELSGLQPFTAIFHPCKDGSLHKALNGKIGSVKCETQPNFSPMDESAKGAQSIIQLARIGDIINILPIARHIWLKTGKRVTIVAHKDFANVLDGATYANKLVYNDQPEDPKRAAYSLRKQFESIKICQLWGKTIQYEKRCKNFAIEQWRLLGYDSMWGRLPLVFDNRDYKRENKLLHSIKSDLPLILTCWNGLSFRFDKSQIMNGFMKRFDGRANVFDLSCLRADRIYDLLGLLDSAHCLVTIDTAILHLARASPVPVVAILPDSDWNAATELDANVILEVKYSKLEDSLSEMYAVIDSTLSRTIVTLIRPKESMTGHSYLADHCKAGLKKHGFDVSVSKIDDKDDVYILNRSRSVLLVHCPHVITPSCWNIIKRGIQLRAFYTWETSLITNVAKERMNECHAVITASEYNRKGFTDSGVVSPIFVIGHGTNEQKYDASDYPAGPFVFGVAGDINAGGTRKRIDYVISAFRHAFKGSANVKLHVKLRRGQSLKNESDDNVVNLSDELDEAGIICWIRGIHCLVSASNSEGWGYWLHQAMMMRRPVISINYSGLCEFWRPEAGKSIPFTIGPANGSYSNYGGDFAYCKAEDIASAMLEMYNEKSNITAVGNRARELAMRFRQSDFDDRLACILRKPLPKFVHTYSGFKAHDPPDIKRSESALKLWDRQYSRARWSINIVYDSQLPRLFNAGFRKLPFVKDMIDTAANSMRMNQVIVFTNTDTLPSPTLSEQLIEAFATNDCCYSYRRDIGSFSELTDEQIRNETDVYAGLDLFAFTKDWWIRNRVDYPDLLYAVDAWDYCMKILMQESGGKEFRFLIYHVKHEMAEKQNAGTKFSEHNFREAGIFLKQRGIVPYWESLVPVNLNPL